MLFFFSCKPCDDPSNPACENYCDDPSNIECFNYDPCFGKNPVSAEFVIEESLPGRSTTYFIESDTVIYGSNLVRFRAIHEAENYTWRIGNDPREWNTRSVTLYFKDYLDISVSLSVSSTPDTSCFPHDNGQDTAIRKLVTVSAAETKLYGVYRMSVVEYPENFPEKWEDGFEIRMTEFAGDTVFSDYGYRIQGFTPRCRNDGFPRSRWGEWVAYRAMTFDTKFENEGLHCNYMPYGIIRHIGSQDSRVDSIEIQSTLYDPSFFPSAIPFKGSLVARGVRVE